MRCHRANQHVCFVFFFCCWKVSSVWTQRSKPSVWFYSTIYAEGYDREIRGIRGKRSPMTVKRARATEDFTSATLRFESYEWLSLSRCGRQSLDVTAAVADDGRVTTVRPLCDRLAHDCQPAHLSTRLSSSAFPCCPDSRPEVSRVSREYQAKLTF